MNLQVEIDIDDAIALLRDADEVVSSSAMLAGARAARKVIESELVIRTPVGDLKKDERKLVDSMTSEVTVDSKGRGVTVDVGFGAQGFKANLVEYGHRMVGHKPDKEDLGVVDPQPFMRPAAEAAAEPAIDAFNIALTNELQAKGVLTGA